MWLKKFDPASLLDVGKFSCLQTTMASSSPQLSSHTVPHMFPMQASTRPSFAAVPFTSLTAPSSQTKRVQLYSLLFLDASALFVYCIIISKHGVMVPILLLEQRHYQGGKEDPETYVQAMKTEFLGRHPGIHAPSMHCVYTEQSWETSNPGPSCLPRGWSGPGVHITPAISEEKQLWLPRPSCGQSSKRCSDPIQLTSSSRMGPVPDPYMEWDTATGSSKHCILRF